MFKFSVDANEKLHPVVCDIGTPIPGVCPPLMAAHPAA